MGKVIEKRSDNEWGWIKIKGREKEKRKKEKKKNIFRLKGTKYHKSSDLFFHIT